VSDKAKDTVVVGTLADLPENAEGSRHLVWWGNLGFMAIEGMGFALAATAYLYLMSRSANWPPPGDSLPSLGWSGVFTAALLLSEVPNLWVLRQARAKNARLVRRGMLLATGIGVVLMALRAIELAYLNVRWDTDAYGSAVWLLLFLHTTHVATELCDTAVQTLWLYTHEIGDAQFADVEDNANYWSFVVLTWLPLYGLVYWLPRLG
jgi:cytochrome c oxidase subunit 3